MSAETLWHGLYENPFDEHVSRKHSVVVGAHGKTAQGWMLNQRGASARPNGSANPNGRQGRGSQAHTSARGIVASLEQLRKRVQSCVKRSIGPDVPALERLGDHEVLINNQLQQQLLEQCAERADQARAEVNKEKLCVELVTQRLLEKCWAPMEVKR